MFQPESRSLSRASLAIGRLDEHLRLHPHPAAIRSWFFRDQAIGVGQAEQLASDKTRLLALLADAGSDVANKADRTALDIYNALALVADWQAEAPSAAQMIDVWRMSEKSNTRRPNPQFELDLERDCESAAQELRAVLENPDPWIAADAVRRMWISQGLRGQARRMSLIVASFAVRRGFHSKHVLTGLSHSLMRDPARTNAILQDDPDGWRELFFSAIADSAERTYDASLALMRAREEMILACDAMRMTREREALIDYGLALPIMKPAAVANAIDMSVRGAQNLFRQMVSVGAMRDLDPQNPTARVYAWPKVLAA